MKWNQNGDSCSKYSTLHWSFCWCWEVGGAWIMRNFQVSRNVALTLKHPWFVEITSNGESTYLAVNDTRWGCLWIWRDAFVFFLGQVVDSVAKETNPILSHHSSSPVPLEHLIFRSPQTTYWMAVSEEWCVPLPDWTSTWSQLSSFIEVSVDACLAISIILKLLRDGSVSHNFDKRHLPSLLIAPRMVVWNQWRFENIFRQSHCSYQPILHRPNENMLELGSETPRWDILKVNGLPIRDLCLIQKIAEYFRWSISIESIYI